MGSLPHVQRCGRPSSSSPSSGLTAVQRAVRPIFIAVGARRRVPVSDPGDRPEGTQLDHLLSLIISGLPAVQRARPTSIITGESNPGALGAPVGGVFPSFGNHRATSDNHPDRCRPSAFLHCAPTAVTCWWPMFSPCRGVADVPTRWHRWAPPNPDVGLSPAGEGGRIPGTLANVSVRA